MKANSNIILVTGAGGQLGSELKDLEAAYPQYHFLFTKKEDLPISDSGAVSSFFAANDIGFCINCAAYTAVDKAEKEAEEAFAINATAAGNLAAVCKAHNTHLVHISSDYVFDGTATRPYRESDNTGPVSAYGISKLKGEELVLANDPSAIIIRSSWIYSSHGNNFVKTMLRLMKERESINVVDDQFGSPTYAADLAGAIMTIVENWPENFIGQPIFNYADSGKISWYEFAMAIKELSGSSCMINPIPGSGYPTPAKRPQYSVLDTTKIKATFNITIPAWKESLQKCLLLLK